MSLDVQIGCSACGHYESSNIELPFNCDDFTCPRCRESNCLSIIAVNGIISVKDANCCSESI